MKPILAAAAAGFLAAGSAAPAAEAAVVKMDAATQARLGVATAPLAPARHSAAVTAFARAVDAGPLAALDADIAAAAAALQASRAEATRTRALNDADQTVSAKAAEQAAAQARSDAAKLALLRRRVGLEWGAAIAVLSDARRARLIADIAGGRAALVRIDAPAGPAASRGTATIDLGAAGRVEAVILGPSRTGEPRLQSTGVLALVRGRASTALGLGVVAPASLAAGAEVAGVIIPRSALIRTDGETFAYVRRDAGSFERRQVGAAASDPRGLFAPMGFHPGEVVVVSGAAKLLTAEKPAEAD